MCGFRMRRSIRLGKGTRLNLSKSGMSVSSKVGRTTFNSRGRTSTRLIKGVSYTTGRSSGKGCGCFPFVLFVAFVLACSKSSHRRLQ